MNYCFSTIRVVACLSLALTLGVSCARQQPDATIRVDASTVEGRVTPWLYGACIEDVNHEIYGGLYDQKIFGESFEEPVPSPVFDNFSSYDGSWEYAGGELSAAAHSGAKLVYDPVQLTSGTAETEVKFLRGGPGDNAGLLVGVSQPASGADNFYGYEISLTADGRRIVVGRHKNNFESVAEVAVQCDPRQWNRLTAVVNTDSIDVLLNGRKVLAFASDDPALAAGKAALRTWNSDVRFRNVKVDGKSVDFRTTPMLSVSRQWDPVKTGTARAGYRHENRDAFNGQCAQTVELLSGEGTAGIANASLNRWGIAVREGQVFEGRIYLKSPTPGMTATVALQNADGTKEYARQRIEGVTGQWQKFPFELTASAADDRARFAVWIDAPGKISVDQATLMTTGADRFKGLPMRNDIGQAMVDQGLTFLRYGGTMVNTPGYRFKKMIGDRDKRPPYTGHWYRYSTNGFGIEDFLQFCEAAGFMPSFAVNIEESPEDMADMVEYLNGPVSSEWGRRRAGNGHPEPYGVKYIGIGNEEVLFNGDNAAEYDHYIERFNLLHDAMKGKDSTLSLVCTAWWRPESPSIEKVFRAMDGKADYWDYHPWADQLTSGKEVDAELRRMQQMFLGWNPDTKLKCAIFEENGNSHNIQRVLGHATVQNAVRRAGDFVLTSCAANALQPYKQNDNGWDQGQVFFTPSQVWGMPPYYAQRMASAAHRPLLVGSRVEGAAENLDVTATRSEDGSSLVLHIVNTCGEPITAAVAVADFGPVAEARRITLSGALEAVNTPGEPKRIVPVEQALKRSAGQTLTIAPYSYTIVELSK